MGPSRILIFCAHSNFEYIDTSPVVSFFVSPCRILCSFITVASFHYSFKYKLGYVEPPHKSFLAKWENSKVKWSIVEPGQVRHENGIKD